MISAHNLSISYNLNTILEDVSFNINPGDRAGLIGPNGCGKSTLLKLLIREIQPDIGNVTYNPPDLKIGYLPQSYEFPAHESLEHILAKLTPDSTYLENRLASLADSITSQPENKDIQDEYDSILKKGKLPMWSTDKGFWGYADPEVCFEIFKKLKLDPAVVSGSFIASVIDVVALLIYLEIARAVMGL